MAEKESAAFMLLALALDDDEKRKRDPTRKWIQRREEEGLYASLVQELMVEDTRTYREMMRMGYDCFKHILQLIEPHDETVPIKKSNRGETRLQLSSQWCS